MKKPEELINDRLYKLKSKLKKVEKELSKCRTSTIEDGWQTQRHSKKARKWDILAQEKMKLLQDIEDLEGEIEYMYLVEFSPREECPKCGETYDDADFDFQICSRCGFDNNSKPTTEIFIDETDRPIKIADITYNLEDKTETIKPLIK